jgi:ferredoxin
MEEIQNPPKIKRIAGNNFKEKYWNRCIGCDDCMKACPVGAIHNTGPEDLYWLDSATCDNFIMKALDSSGKPSHERKFWQKLIPRKHIKGGKEMTVPVCRECQVQPRCSNWDGKYPYEKDLYVGTKLWWLMRNFFDQRMKNRDPHGVSQLPQKE